ncbi:PhoX family protein [Streptomyces sp. WAC 00631]|uniref:alkaline phosphatase PhoX n=1 Tax=unclassified Streptomyces TaxID=2593676 RepID=UPI000F7B94E9|nr:MULTISPECIES: alkaline phosphatase PhoX [unclassified Streptomyces]MCC5032504.1 PhoX family protein [Streptomyces sp. WAC 00631]MCC9740607.1 PhoX family protein [Streptomyces sp. MNU89]
MRRTRRTRLITAALAVGMGLPLGLLSAAPTSAHGHGHGRSHGGPMAFQPIEGSAYDRMSADWSEPLVAPQGFRQKLVADETVLDIYGGGTDDLTDMNTVNETGRQAGRYLYRTHEVSSNGAVSVVDLKTGEAKVIAQRADWRRLDGVRWTPWGSLLVTEETNGGRVFELFLDRRDRTEVTRIEERRQLGILRHEGIDVLPDGTVFVIDELNGGSVYKFVPTRRGDLSEGRLHALKINGLSDAAQKWNPETYGEKTGAFTWVPLDKEQVLSDADAASDAVNATEFGRPEDVEVIGDTLYVANTSENRVVAVNLRKNVLSAFVQAGVNAPVEDRAAGITGFKSPDNLAQGPDGRLWIVEDNYASDIWVAGRDRDRDGAADSTELFASLKDPGAEVSGIYFGKDPKTLFFSVQHPDKPLADGTWKITRRR